MFAIYFCNFLVTYIHCTKRLFRGINMTLHFLHNHPLKRIVYIISLSRIPVMPLLSQYTLPRTADSSISLVKSDSDLCAYWEASGVGAIIFASAHVDKLMKRLTDEKKVQQMSHWHNALWPGMEVPDAVEARHKRDVHGSQELWWKKKLLPTSVVFAWLVWGLSNVKRMPADRQRVREFFSRLVEHILTVHGKLDLLVSQIGGPATEVPMQLTLANGRLDGRLLWTKALKNRIREKWNIKKLLPSHYLSSDIDRPTLTDLIFFSFDNSCQPEAQLLVPLALSCVKQLAAVIEQNLPSLTLDDPTSSESRKKNRALDSSALMVKVTNAGHYLLHENEAQLHVAIVGLLVLYFSHLSSLEKGSWIYFNHC